MGRGVYIGQSTGECCLERGAGIGVADWMIQIAECSGSEAEFGDREAGTAEGPGWNGIHRSSPSR